MITYLDDNDMILIKHLKKLGKGKFEAKGNDPIIELKNLPKGLIQNISIVLNTNNGSMIQIFWSYEDNQPYSDNATIKLEHHKDSTYNFLLNSEKEIKKLRLDPTNLDGIFEIKEIKIFYLPLVLKGISQRTSDLVRYIIRFQPHCDRYLSPLCDPRGKSVLVIGSGHGTEMLWSIKNGATEVVGIDIEDKNTDALDVALQQLEIDHDSDYQMLKMSVEEIGDIGKKFDIVLSNNVFEHLPDLNKAFDACKKVIKAYDGRIIVFADPLFYSSNGSHIPTAEPWEHLSNSDIKSKTDEHLWEQYTTLNRMTLSDFIKSIELNDLIILKLSTVPDRNLGKLKAYMDIIDTNESITNLTIEGLSLELMKII